MQAPYLGKCFVVVVVLICEYFSSHVAKYFLKISPYLKNLSDLSLQPRLDPGSIPQSLNSE